jgi:hypothetical protein
VVAVDIDLGEQLKVRGRGLDTTLGGNLKLGSVGGRLTLNGIVTAGAGTYAAYGQKLEIDRGLLIFSGDIENPMLDVLALRPNLDMQVGVAITGPLHSPRVRLYASTDMSDSDKLSWLVLGRASDGLGRSDTALLQRAAVALLAGEGEAPTDTLAAQPGPGPAEPAPERHRRARDRHLAGQAAVTALVRGLRARRQRHQRHLAADLPHRPALHAARAVGAGELARPDLGLAAGRRRAGARAPVPKSAAAAPP